MRNSAQYKSNEKDQPTVLTVLYNVHGTTTVLYHGLLEKALGLFLVVHDCIRSTVLYRTTSPTFTHTVLYCMSRFHHYLYASFMTRSS